MGFQSVSFEAPNEGLSQMYQPLTHLECLEMLIIGIYEDLIRLKVAVEKEPTNSIPAFWAELCLTT